MRRHCVKSMHYERTIRLLELAEVVIAAFEESPHDQPEDRRGGRLFRAVLLGRLKDRYGDAWVRAWNLVTQRQERP